MSGSPRHVLLRGEARPATATEHHGQEPLVEHLSEKTMNPGSHVNRWKADLEKLNARIAGLLLDDEVAWSVRAMVKKNARLRADSTVFLDMFWFGYLHRTVMRLRVMVDGNPRSVSLVNLLRDMIRHYDVLQQATPPVNCPSMEDLRRWEEEITAAARPVKKYANKEVAHWDRRGTGELQYVQVRRAVWEASRLLRRLHMAIVGGNLYPHPQTEPWKAVFQYPWWPADVPVADVASDIERAQLEALADREGWPKEQ